MNKNFNSKYSTDNLLVVLPIGGKATRLLPLTEDISKPLLPLFNKPLIDSLLFSLSKQGLKNFILGTQGYVNSIDLYDHLKFGEEFRRLWEYYLIISESAFRNEYMTVFQIQLSKKTGSVPVSRDYMYNSSNM